MIAARARRLAALALAALLAAGALAFVADRDSREPVARQAAAEKPELLLLTSLPLIFPETFAIEGGGSDALKALEARYRVKPISVADADNLKDAELLLMAQPLAQPAEALVELDAWVRRGGRVLLLADPMLEWESALPLGDALRPPLMFADTGLLRHWGLRLDAPDDRGPASREIAGREVLAVSPGALIGQCPIERGRLIARCSVGRGRATIIADADLLDVERIDGPTEHNLRAVVAELERLEAE